MGTFPLASSSGASPSVMAAPDPLGDDRESVVLTKSFGVVSIAAFVVLALSLVGLDLVLPGTSMSAVPGQSALAWVLRAVLFCAAGVSGVVIVITVRQKANLAAIRERLAARQIRSQVSEMGLSAQTEQLRLVLGAAEMLASVTDVADLAAIVTKAVTTLTSASRAILWLASPDGGLTPVGLDTAMMQSHGGISTTGGVGMGAAGAVGGGSPNGGSAPNSGGSRDGGHFVAVPPRPLTATPQAASQPLTPRTFAASDQDPTLSAVARTGGAYLASSGAPALGEKVVAGKGWAVPLVASDETLGVLELQGVDRPNPAVASLVTALASHAASAIDVNRRYTKLRQASFTDPLTSLLNRWALDLALAEECQRAARSGANVAVIMVDVDHFKSYNDRLGHQSGDDCLQAVAHQLAKGLRRAGDRAFRYGGEEFVVLLPGADTDSACVAAERLRLAVKHAEELMGIGRAGRMLEPVTASFGVASSVAGRRSPAELLAAADTALYEAKRQGRDRVVAAPSDSAPTPHRQAS